MSLSYGPFDVRLVRREQLSPHFVRITLTGPDLARCGDVLLDQRVKLLLGGNLDSCLGEDWYANWLQIADDERPEMRTYTLADVRADGSAGEVDIDVVVGDHPGPGATFASEAALGSRTVLVAAIKDVEGWDSVGVAWQPGQAEQVLIMGDATAVPAIRNIARRLDGRAARIVVEVPSPDDRLDLGVEVTWCDDLAAEAERLLGSGTGTEDEVGASEDDGADDVLWQEATSPGRRYVWVAGEAGELKRVRAALRHAGFQRHETSVMGYWKA